MNKSGLIVYKRYDYVGIMVGDEIYFGVCFLFIFGDDWVCG